eukprot:1156440-Pelagomonas_calceolata.AAC.3
MSHQARVITDHWQAGLQASCCIQLQTRASLVCRTYTHSDMHMNMHKRMKRSVVLDDLKIGSGSQRWATASAHKEGPNCQH